MLAVSFRQLCAKSLVAVGVLAAAWAVTGVAPFTATAYVALFLAAVVVVLAGSKDPASRLGRRRTLRPRAGPAPRRGPQGQLGIVPMLPWLLIAVAAAGLEAAGLALGGRSPRMATLSTAVDHLLAWHVTRWIAFLAWAWLGVAGIWRWSGAPDAELSEQSPG